VLRKSISSRASIESQVSQKVADVAVKFSAAQYNVLADYLGSNTEPWFLYGVPVSLSLPLLFFRWYVSVACPYHHIQSSL
jgi:hypothetical protein